MEAEVLQNATGEYQVQALTRGEYQVSLGRDIPLLAEGEVDEKGVIVTHPGGFAQWLPLAKAEGLGLGITAA